MGLQLNTPFGGLSFGSIGHKDKDPGRMQHVKDLIARASAGDRFAWDGNGQPGAGAHDNLLWWSTHYATNEAKAAALAGYNLLKPKFALAVPSGATGVMKTDTLGAPGVFHQNEDDTPALVDTLTQSWQDLAPQVGLGGVSGQTILLGLGAVGIAIYLARK